MKHSILSSETATHYSRRKYKLPTQPIQFSLLMSLVKETVLCPASSNHVNLLFCVVGEANMGI